MRLEIIPINKKDQDNQFFKKTIINLLIISFIFSLIGVLLGKLISSYNQGDPNDFITFLALLFKLILPIVLLHVYALLIYQKNGLKKYFKLTKISFVYYLVNLIAFIIIIWLITFVFFTQPNIVTEIILNSLAFIQSVIFLTLVLAIIYSISDFTLKYPVKNNIKFFFYSLLSIIIIAYGFRIIFDYLIIIFDTFLLAFAIKINTGFVSMIIGRLAMIFYSSYVCWYYYQKKMLKNNLVQFVFGFIIIIYIIFPLYDLINNLIS